MIDENHIRTFDSVYLLGEIGTTTGGGYVSQLLELRQTGSELLIWRGPLCFTAEQRAAPRRRPLTFCES